MERPLVTAVRAGDLAAVCSLADARSVREADASGWTAAHHAALRGADAVLAVLVLAGPRVDAAAANGLTPLLIAAEMSRGASVRDAQRAAMLAHAHDRARFRLVVSEYARALPLSMAATARLVAAQQSWMHTLKEGPPPSVQLRELRADAALLLPQPQPLPQSPQPQQPPRVDETWRAVGEGGRWRPTTAAAWTVWA